MLFYWNEEDDEEDKRLKKWQAEDPIALQDAFNTSHALVDYCKNNDFQGFSQLVDEAEQGECLFAHVVQGFMIAVSNLQVDIINKFLEQGLYLECEVFADAIHVAVEAAWKDPSDYRVTRVVQIIHLLTRGSRMSGGIPVDALRIRDGFTPLCSACVVGSVKITDCLLSLKADPNMITRDNTSPLEIATRCGHEEVVARLKKANAGTNAKDVLRKIRNLGPLGPEDISEGETKKTETCGLAAVEKDTDGDTTAESGQDDVKDKNGVSKKRVSFSCTTEGRDTNGVTSSVQRPNVGRTALTFCAGVEESF